MHLGIIPSTGSALWIYEPKRFNGSYSSIAYKPNNPIHPGPKSTRSKPHLTKTIVAAALFKGKKKVAKK